MNHRLQRRIRHLLLTGAVAATTATNPASAQSLYYGEVTAGANAIGFGRVVQPPTQGLLRDSPVPFSPLIATREANLTDNAAAATLVGRSTALASAEAGAIRLQTTTSGWVTAGGFSSPNPNASGQALATARFRDVLIFDVANAAPGASFTVAVTFGLQVDSRLNATLVASSPPSFVVATSEWQTRVSMVGGTGWLFQDNRRASCQWAGAMVCNGDTPGLVTVLFSATNGSRNVFEMSATARSFAGGLLAGPGSVFAESIVDMGHTLAWGGVTSVLDAAGQPVTHFSMVGLGSGVDFRLPFVTAVPEPAGGAMALAGLALLMVWRRLQRPRRAR